MRHLCGCRNLGPLLGWEADVGGGAGTSGVQVFQKAVSTLKRKSCPSLCACFIETVLVLQKAPGTPCPRSVDSCSGGPSRGAGGVQAQGLTG